MTSDPAHTPSPLRWTIPVLVNVLIGLLALVPLGCAWWLLSEWLPMDCRSVRDSYSPDFTGTCNYSTLDNGPVMMTLGAASGTLVLLLTILANRGLARDEDIGRATWVRAAPFVLLPFVVVWVLA